MFGEEKSVEFHEKNSSPSVKHGGGWIMRWACVAASGTSNVSLVEGRVDLMKYQQILEGNIMPSGEKLKVKSCLYSRIMILNTPQNPQWTTSRGAS